MENLRQTISTAYLADEDALLESLIAKARMSPAEAEATGWTTASWFTTPSADLDEQTPIAWVKAGCNLETALDAARAAAAPLRW